MENYVILYREIRRERYSLLEYLKNEKKLNFLEMLCIAKHLLM